MRAIPPPTGNPSRTGTPRAPMAKLVRVVLSAGMASVAVVMAAAQARLSPPGQSISSPASRTQRTGEPFVPSRHGFAFVNRFSGSSLPPELRDAQEGLLLWARKVAETYGDLPEEFGLCGGMSLAAADHYLSGTPVPDSEAPPEQGTDLYDAIYQRQRDSLGLGSAYILKFAHWMSLPDTTPAARDDVDADRGESTLAESTSSLTRVELTEICRALERSELVPLGLVLTRAGRGKLWNNHQVLAYGLNRIDDATLGIAIYDPNYPGDDGCVLRVEGIGVGVIGLEPGRDAERIAALDPGSPATTGETVRIVRLPSQAAPRAVRGIFAMPYEPVEPAGAGAAAAPAGVGAAPGASGQPVEGVATSPRR